MQTNPTENKPQDAIIEKVLNTIDSGVFNDPNTGLLWLSDFVKKYHEELDSSNGFKPGQQLKLAPMNKVDDLIEVLKNSEEIADKFYTERTLKSSIELRKVYLDISKQCLQERKVVLEARGKKPQN